MSAAPTSELGQPSPGPEAPRQELPWLELNQITVPGRGRPRLDRVSLAIGGGERVALLGPSGAGKSSLLAVANGLLRPASGSLRWLGAPPARSGRARRRQQARIGTLWQDLRLIEELSVQQNLNSARLAAWGWPRALLNLLWPLDTAANRAALAQVDLGAELLDQPVSALSGGQRQRVALGRALVRQPKAFLMDEPLSNLDAALRVHTRAEIVELHKRAGVVTLYVTHDQEEALSMADRVAVMMGGRILQIATPEQIYHDPIHLDVASFVGSPRINLVPVSVTASGVACLGDDPITDGLAANAGDKVLLGVRPEDVQLHREAQEWSAPAILQRVEFLGAEALAHLQLVGHDDPLIARLAPQQAAAFRAGEALFATPRQDRILAFGAGGERVARLGAASIHPGRHAA